MPPTPQRPRRAAALRSRAALVAAVCAATLASRAAAADLPPAVVARFTREVQPLLLNRCAAGACHGGPQAHAPRLHRGDTRGAVASSETLANAESFRGLLGPDGDPRPLIQRLSVRHPAGSTSRTLVMQPLTPRERLTLEGWLAAARPVHRDAAVQPAGHAEPAPPRPNRLQTLLDTAANPPEIPPPQEPQGIILGADAAE